MWLLRAKRTKGLAAKQSSHTHLSEKSSSFIQVGVAALFQLLLPKFDQNRQKNRLENPPVAFNLSTSVYSHVQNKRVYTFNDFRKIFQYTRSY